VKHTVSQHDDDDNGSGIVGKVMMLGVFFPNSLETGRFEERWQQRPTDSWLTTALEETCVGAVCDTCIVGYLLLSYIART